MVAIKSSQTSLKKLDKAIKEGILYDPKLITFLLPFFDNDKKVAQQFIQQCLRKMKTRRMLLHTQWFSEIADGMDVIQRHRPSLQLVFLMALAEGVAKQRMGKIKKSQDAVMKFFHLITPSDEKHLEKAFRRSLADRDMHRLTLTSKLRILYEVRNRVVHGQEFWNFFFLDKKSKEKYENEKYTDYGLLTEGWLGKRGKKRRVSIDMTLTYDEFRNIVIRTALENIKAII